MCSLSGEARSDNLEVREVSTSARTETRRFRDVPVNWILEKGLLFPSRQDDETLSVGRV